MKLQAVILDVDGTLVLSEVLMIGDTPYDIQSANGAGVGLIAVRCGGFDDEQLKEAIAIYDDPADLLAHYANSPFGKTK